ncbi:MAG: MBL fold metallo-hydrolase [Candidatus Omnitrophica bacterium]|nr:MBL fold metallo-hydrolase [Candidatus Omnitrophota bacterium]
MDSRLIGNDKWYIAMATKLYIQQYEIGPINNFVYLLGDPQTKEMVIIDPAWDIDFLSQEAKRLGYKITGAFLSHAHPDHLNGLHKLVSLYHVPVYISKYELPIMRPAIKGLIDVKDKDKLSIGQISVDVLHTPGHSPGCQCFLVKNQLFTGDVLFIDGCGRCDLPGSDPKAMYNSLYNILMKLPDETIIYPGHHYGPIPSDTMGHQKKTNPYLCCHNMKEFLVERMGL